MPSGDTSQNNNQNNNQNNQNNNQNDNQNNTGQLVSQSKEVILGCDRNQVDDAGCQNKVKSVLEQGGYKVQNLNIDPNAFATYSYTGDAKGKIGVYLMAGSLISYLDAASGNFDYNILGIRGDVSSLGTKNGFQTKGVPKDHHGDCTIPECDQHQGKTYPQLNEIYKDRCMAVPGETPEKLGQNILAAIQGKGFSGGGGAQSTVSSGGGAQIKDTTFEHCIRRICAATDSIFIVDNNIAVLFPYTDWMAFTLRQKIDTISKKEIDPDVFSINYNNDGFYNKVSIAWGGVSLPERFHDNKAIEHNNFTMEDIAKKMDENNIDLSRLIYSPDNNQTTTTSKTKKPKTTQEISVDKTGSTILSEQYDSLVKKYGVLEKRVESKAPDLETAQYIANALLIQYVRDFNNTCECRALTKKKYNGGTFHIVENPFTKETEMFYLNGYNLRLHKQEPLYHDLHFRYGPESAEELADYQSFGGGGGGGASTANGATGPASSTEEQIWMDAAKCKWAQDQEDCSTNDPATAKKHYDDYTKQGKEVHFDCFGMSAYLYYRFNYEAHIPCQVVGDSNHKVVMLNRGNGFVSTADEYRKYNLDHDFKWRESQNTALLLAAPSNMGSVGGNTNNNKPNTNTQGNGNGGRTK